MDNIFTELASIIIIATVIAGVMQSAKQPLIIGHIITGLIVGPHFLDVLHSASTIEIFSQMGIALLLFIIGLNLSPGIIKEVGKVSLITGLGQVLFTSIIGYGIGLVLGYRPIESLYIAIAMTFSSTIIIMKLLSDKKDLGRLYGKISIGFLLVQDLIATLILIAATSYTPNVPILSIFSETLVKGAITVAILALFIVYVLPKLTDFFARSQEFLFLFAISWGLGMAALFQSLGFSIEIGALFAGVALATSPYTYEISARLRPLRDFFIVLFFILLGSRLIIDNATALIVPAVVYSLFILIGNPLIVMILMRSLGYNKQTGFKAGLTVAQISEFSLILVVLGHRLGHLSYDTVSMVTIVGLVTIAASTYMILYSDKLYSLLLPILGIFTPAHQTPAKIAEESPQIILFGYDRVGDDFIRSFKKLDKKFIVVDYNPEIIDRLTREKIECRYGDANDNEILEELGLDNVQLAVSTMSDFDTNLLLTRLVKKHAKRSVVIVKSDTINEAGQLYEAGASYVLMPHYISTSYASDLIDTYGFDLSQFIKEKEKHIRYLEKRRSKGYDELSPVRS